MPEYLVYVYNVHRFDADRRPRYFGFASYGGWGFCAHRVNASSWPEAERAAVRSHKSACVKAEPEEEE